MERRDRKEIKLFELMEKNFLKVVFTLLLIVLLSSGSNAYVQTVQRPTGIVPFLQYLPPTYSETGEGFPMIIFLHGSGETGDGSDAQIWKVAKNGPPKHIEAGDDMCFTINGKEECFVVVSPQITSSWQPRYINKLVAYMLENYNVDPNRIYLTGLSLGGAGTYTVAGDESNEPNQFAAIAPVAAKGACDDAERIGQRKIPVWQFHGDADTSIPLSQGLSVYNCIFNGDPDPEPIMTIYPGVGHSSWINAYQTNHSVHNPNLYEWFLSHSLDGSNNASPAPTPSVSISAGTDCSALCSQDSILLVGQVLSGEDQVSSCWWAKNSGPDLDPACEFKNDTLIIRNVVAGTYKLDFNATDAASQSYSDQMTLTVIADNSGSGYEIIIDNNDAAVELSGSWVTSTAGGTSKYGSNYYHDGNLGQGSKTATYNISVPEPGEYQLSLFWFAYDNRASNAKVIVDDGSNQTTLSVNQTANGSTWYSIGSYIISSQAKVIISNEGADGYVIADALKVVQVSTSADRPAGVSSLIIDNTDSGFSSIGTWAASTAGGTEKYLNNYLHDNNESKGSKQAIFQGDELIGEYQVFAKWFAYTNRASNVPVTIEHSSGETTVSLDQRSKDSEWVLIGTYTFDGTGKVTISNSGTDGYVVADAIKFELVQTANAREAAVETTNYSWQESLKDIKIYPNPARDNLSVDLSGIASSVSSEVHMRIINLRGDVVLDGMYSEISAGPVNLELNDLIPGVYVLNVYSAEFGNSTFKFIKE